MKWQVASRNVVVNSMYQAIVIADYLSKMSGIKWLCIRENEDAVFRGAPHTLHEVFPGLLDLIGKAWDILAKVEGGKQQLKSITLNTNDGVLKVMPLENRMIIIKCDSKIDQELEKVITLLHTSRVIKCSVCSLDLKLAFDRCSSCLSILPFISQRCPYCGRDLAVKKCPKCGTSIYSDGSRAPLLFKKSYARFRRIEI